MKALFIGGTGTISSAISSLAIEKGVELTLLTRSGNGPEGAERLICDVNDEDRAFSVLKGRSFDVVVDFVAFRPEQVERDIRLFQERTGQYIFISSASTYQKPLAHPVITESTPLYNPYWQYARDKIACETLLMAAYRSTAFPVTIVRPSHTYGDCSVPVAIHGAQGSWQVLARMLEGKPVIVHGDGLSLWTFTHNTDFARGFYGLMGDLLSALRPELLGTLLGDKANSVIFDNSKIKRLVPGFFATVRFDEGVRRTVEYVRSHPECQKADPEFDAWCDRVIKAYSSCVRSF